jgi:hypothetical protein
MNYKIQIEFILSLTPGKFNDFNVLHHKENFWNISTRFSFWLFTNKDRIKTYNENFFPSLNYYNQFYYQGSLFFSLTYDLNLKQKNLSFFKTL